MEVYSGNVIWGKVKLLGTCSRIIWVVGYVVDPGKPMVPAPGFSLNTLYIVIRS
jgi:hypothetical protein